MIKSPSKQTLKKYGFSSQKDWEDLLISQKYKCPICEREFSDTVRPVVDHYHFPKYKKLPPERRREFVRGLLCVYDNLRVVHKAMTTKKAYNAWKYLEAFDNKIK